MLLGQSVNSQVKAISTGSILIDQVFGYWWFACGAYYRSFGPEAPGKTTLAFKQ